MKVNGAIFDMDGLLFDTESVYQQTWQEIAIERNIKLDSSFLNAICGTSGMYMCHIIEKYYHVCDGTEIIEECMERIKKKLSAHVPMKKGACEILNFFQEKEIYMAVASSSSAQQIESNLEIAGIRNYFSSIVSGTQVRHGKPAPDIFLCAAESINCKPDECFVFEDSENGIKAGYTAGCITIMVPDLIEASPDILPYCTKICQNLLQAKEEVMKMLTERRPLCIQ